MNTMVGMQASLHTPTEDSLSDLMKNGNAEGSGAQGLSYVSVAAAAAPTDLETEDGDDFDAEELLKSPLFNDSAEKLDNDDEELEYAVRESIQSHAGNNVGNQLGQPKREFVPMGLRRSDGSNFAVMKQHQLPHSHMRTRQFEPYDMGEGNMMYGGRNSHQSYHNDMFENDLHRPNRFEPNTSSSGHFSPYQPNNQMMDDVHAEFAVESGNMNLMNPYLNRPSSNREQMYGTSPERSNSNASSSYGSDSSPTPRAATSGMLDMSQGSRMSNNGMDISQNTPMFRRAPQRSQTYHPGLSRNPLEMMKEQQQLEIKNDGENNQLERMQQHLQQMQDIDNLEMQLQHQNRDGNAGLDRFRTDRPVNLPSRSISCGPMRGLQDRHGDSLSRAQFNTSSDGRGLGVPSDMETLRTEFNNQYMSGGGTARGSASVRGNGGSGPVSVNDAMEKLCESMKRSAMSRTLVKQFSSGARGVARNNSTGLMIGSRQVGGRDVRRTSSNRNAPVDDTSHRSSDRSSVVPVRRVSSTKHHLPGRGVYRHSSGHMVGVNNLGNTNISFQIDGRKLGPR